jgi:hypothetical protein
MHMMPYMWGFPVGSELKAIGTAGETSFEAFSMAREDLEMGRLECGTCICNPIFIGV